MNYEKIEDLMDLNLSPDIENFDCSNVSTRVLTMIFTRVLVTAGYL